MMGLTHFEVVGGLLGGLHPPNKPPGPLQLRNFLIIGVPFLKFTLLTFGIYFACEHKGAVHAHKDCTLALLPSLSDVSEAMSISSQQSG